MAITILPKENTLGEQFGTGLGGGFQSGLDNLMKHQMKKLESQQQFSKNQTFWKGILPNASPQIINSIASGDAAVQKSLLDRLEGLNIPLGGQSTQVAPQGQPGQQGALPSDQGMGQVQAPQKPGGVTIGATPAAKRHNALMEMQERHHKEAQEFKVQEGIEKQNAPFKKYLETNVEPARDVDKLADEISGLMDSNEIQFGSIKSFTPDRFLNSKTQALMAKVNELITKRAQLGKGVPSRARLLLEQASKIHLWQKPEAARYILNSIKESVQRPLELENISNQLIEKNGKEPKNLKQLALKQYANDNLPDPKDYSDGTELELEGYKFKKENNAWKEIKG